MESSVSFGQMSLKCLRSAGTDRMCNRNWDTNFSEYLAAITGLDDRVRAATNSQVWLDFTL